MNRTPMTARADHAPPRITLLRALGLTALVVPVRQPTSDGPRDGIDFIAIVAEGRLRYGSFALLPENSPPRTAPKDLITHACRPPERQSDLAREIATAVDRMESGYSIRVFNRNPPFRLAGWSPDSRRGCMEGRPDYASRREPPGFGWLDGEPLDDATADRLWDAGLAPLVTPEDVEATTLFDVLGGVDFDAFDACRHTGPAGATRRAFVRDNPLLANVVMRDPALRAMVDGGMRLRDILDAMSGGPEVDLWPPNPAGRRTASKRAVANMSGRTLVPDGPMLFQGDALAAAEELPRDWLPRGEEEAIAYTTLCGVARGVFSSPIWPPRKGMWLQAMAGAAGRWGEFAARVAEARGPRDLPLLDRVNLLQDEDAGARHFIRDILVPVSTAHGDGTAVGLAGHVVRREGSRYDTDAFPRFARDALFAGMALPAYADFLRRHEAARGPINRVLAAYPPAGAGGPGAEGASTPPEILVLPDGRRIQAMMVVANPNQPKAGQPNGPITQAVEFAFFDNGEPGASWYLGYACSDGSAAPPWHAIEAATMERWGSPAGLLDGVMPHGLPELRLPLGLRMFSAPYDVEAPGAIEAMLEAWRRALPRRWRKLDARGLAAAFDAEAAAYARSHGIPLGTAEPVHVP